MNRTLLAAAALAALAVAIGPGQAGNTVNCFGD
jgi:hypothetical protein